ncbi:TPR repeat-containing protein ZIP4 isoform X2 [Magnolia sinica]|uniref:TPR repeat-containing protein ZIP4 isoform X2 n=1 Tax=Magnolia sinica TaxID=86752 RepID=UPI002659BC4B|nr:TPR repeat-containing protein ZIP4 isoform X2 [Magnolia sinica]
MRISEISPEIRSAPPESHSLLLEELESSIKEAENLSPASLSQEKLSGKLQNTLSHLNSALPLPESGKLQIWKFSYRLWNACVDLSNATGISSEENPDLRRKINEEQANLRQIAADLLCFAGNVAGVPSPAFKSASFYYKTGLIWHGLKKFDLAANCFDRATDLMSKIEIESVSDTEERRFLLELNLARSQTAWEVSEQNLALALLNRSKNLLYGNPESYKILAEQYLQFGKIVLSKDQRSSINEARKLIDEAVDLCEKGLTTGIARRPMEAAELKNLQSKSLRFLAAAHLQMEEFESVLKCVRVLRDSTSEEHPSISFLAMKAWLGLGRYGEAEKELKGMVVNKAVPEGVCVSAVEAFFEGAGAAGAEAVKVVFLGLLGRCHISARAAIRVVQRLVSGSGGHEGSVVRDRVVAELVSDERVVTLFTGRGKDDVAKERCAMHTILWNSGAEHFRSKDYGTSAEMFEKSMLYIPHDVENRILRAKCFRVLCLCHLALSQLDRAEEYINQAQKLESNIACTFLKFKIYLQKNDESAAMNQMQAMVNCLDFNPEFFTLSAHEAMACRALPVAIASLSNLLNQYSPGKPMPMPEVAVLRNVIVLLFQISDSQPEILKFMRRAHTRMSELGTEQFFGNGAVGNRELNWFAGNSWNMGIKTGMINGEKQRKAALTDFEVKRGIEMLDRAGKILTSTMKATQSTSDQPTTVDSSLFFLHTLHAYHLHDRLDNDKRSQQLYLIKSFASLKACTPQNLLQIGLTASHGLNSNPEAAHFAFNACLTAHLASASPDYHKIALVVRKLAVLTGSRDGDVDNEAYAAYRQAYRIMVGLKEGEYPAEEGKWLAITAWNRSVLPGRLGQVDMARRWMKMGLELARCVPGMEGYKGCMEECLAGIEKLGGDGCRDGEGGESESRNRLLL